MIDRVLQAMEDGERITLSLLLTRRCNFECGHCMYSCGPDEPADYMSNATLSKVQSLADRIHSLGGHPEINLIGGEPTLDMERFAQLLRYVSTWGYPICMSTNGWWLQNVEDTRAFLNAVGPYIEPDGTYGAFSVRVSNDYWHDQFRPEWLQNDKLARRLRAIWGYDPDFPVLEQDQTICEVCCHIEDGYYETCVMCGGSDVWHDTIEMVDFTIPEPNHGGPWIYVDVQVRDKWDMNPQGRAAKWGRHDPAAEYGCTAGTELSFLPDGRLMDICCNGAWCEFGTVDDDPLLLLALAREFSQVSGLTCTTCRSTAARWAEDNLNQLRERFAKKLETI